MATATVIQKSKRFSEVVDSCKNRMSKVIYKKPMTANVIYELPFKIRITNIKVPGYSPSNIPPIGIAIVGINNYIL